MPRNKTELDKSMEKNLKAFKRDSSSKTIQKPAWKKAFNEVLHELNPRNLIELPYRAITREKARNEEVKIARKHRTEKGTSFRELFKRRIDDLNLPYRKAVITGDYRIEYTKDTDNDTEGDVEGRSISYLGLVPYGLETHDLYKFILYKLYEDFNDYWKVIAIDWARINYVSDISTRDIKMRGIRLKNMILNQLNNIEIKARPGHCVLDYIWFVCNGKEGFKRYSKAALEHELRRFVIDYDAGVSTRQLVRWRDECHRNVSIYALDPMYKCFEFSPAPGHSNSTDSVRLCYLVQDSHCFPILNEEIITKVAKKANGTIDQLASKIEYSCESDLIYAPDYLSEDHTVWESGYNNYVIVLPKGFCVQKAMALSIKRTEATVPFFKYNNRNMLSAFVHPKLDTLFVENEDYLVRKNVCDILYNQFPVEQFKFRNQSLTKIGNNIFEVVYGYVIKSSYNQETVETLNANGPNALIQAYVFKNEEEMSDLQLSMIQEKLVWKEVSHMIYVSAIALYYMKVCTIYQFTPFTMP